MSREAKPKGPKIIKHRDAKVDRTQTERCLVCKKSMPRVAPAHLREHGLTVLRYERMYGARLSPNRSERVEIGSSPHSTKTAVDIVGDRLMESKHWVSCLADEVGERMLTGPLRLRLTAQLVTMLAARAKVHGEAITILSHTLAELRQEWRVNAGGENGGATDTDVLLRLVAQAAKLVNDSEDAVQRTMKLALEEQKAALMGASAIGPTLYTGTGEKLDMPAGLPSSDREVMRNLLALVGKAANERGTVDALPTSPTTGLSRGPKTTSLAVSTTVTGTSNLDDGGHPLEQGNGESLSGASLGPDSIVVATDSIAMGRETAPERIVGPPEFVGPPSPPPQGGPPPPAPAHPGRPKKRASTSGSVSDPPASAPRASRKPPKGRGPPRGRRPGA